MAVRSEREKLKMQEKYQMILSQMLREEDNKYCVDCDAKSPRWASWNLGVFICIRCAGFHRNLGVHISKVKSVNLDSWTGEQITSMQAMGNSRARAVYEANLPDGFRRPQADSALESFIRAKYEQRKWIAKEWIPFEITVPIDLIESEPYLKRVEPTLDARRAEKKVLKLKPFPPPVIEQTVQPIVCPKRTGDEGNNTQNLLNLNDSPSHCSTHTSSAITTPASNVLDSLHELFTTTSVNELKSNTDIPSINQELADAFSSSSHQISTNTSKMMSNEKIMALFNTTPTSIMNIRPASVQTPHPPSPDFVYPPTQHFHPLAPPKSFSFSNNLHQHAGSFGPQSQIRSTSGLNHHHSDGMSTSTLPSPASSFTPEQLNTQFSQLLPFANTKSNPSAAALITHMPMRPVTEYMPASSDFLWQS